MLKGSVAEGQGSAGRSISLLAAIGIIVGFVVGASIFILVGPLAGTVGPGLPFAYLIAAVPAVFACLYNIQLAGALPTTGANYVAGTRFISPFFGFVTTWMVLVGAVFGVPLLAVGFGSYMNALVPGTPVTLTAVGVVVLLGVINLLGLRFAAVVQVLLVVMFLAALLLYVVAGVPHIDAGNYTPLFPTGASALLLGGVSAYYSFTGFTVITEVAGEVKNARRNVPIAIIVSFVLVLVIYVSVTFVLTGTLGWQVAGESPSAVAESAESFLPRAAVGFISIGALFASATTINAVFASLSRDVVQLGRDRVFPSVLGAVHARSKSPRAAISLLTVLSVIGVLFAFSIERYAQMTVFAFLVIHLITSAAVLRLPKVQPELWAMSPFRFRPFWRWCIFIGVVVLSISIIGFASYSNPFTGILFLVLAGIAVPYWLLRKRTLAARGINLDESMRMFSDDMSDELGIERTPQAGSATTVDESER